MCVHTQHQKFDFFNVFFMVILLLAVFQWWQGVCICVVLILQVVRKQKYIFWWKIYGALQQLGRAERWLFCISFGIKKNHWCSKCWHFVAPLVVLGPSWPLFCGVQLHALSWERLEPISTWWFTFTGQGDALWWSHPKEISKVLLPFGTGMLWLCTLLLVESPFQSSEQSGATAVRKGCLPSGGKPSSDAARINRNWFLGTCEGEKPLPFPNSVLLKFIFHLLNSVVTRNTVLWCGCGWCLFSFPFNHMFQPELYVCLFSTWFYFVDLRGPLCPVSVSSFQVRSVCCCCTLVFLSFLSSHDRDSMKGERGGAVVQKMQHLHGCILLSLSPAHHPLLSHPTAPPATGS